MKCVCVCVCFRVEYGVSEARHISIRYEYNIPFSHKGPSYTYALNNYKRKTEKWNKRFVETIKLPKSQQTKTITHTERYTQSLDSNDKEEKMMCKIERGRREMKCSFFFV